MGAEKMHVFKVIQAGIVAASSLLSALPSPRRRPSRAPTSRWCSPAAPASRPASAGSVGHSSTHCAGRLAAGRSAVYPVNYPASTDFGNPDFAVTVIDGIRDAGSHIESMAANCPKTREVLGGYSQGAAVAGYVTSAAVPTGVPAGIGTAADAAGRRQPRRRRHAVRHTVGSVPAEVRRANDRYRPAVSAQDPGVVRAGRRDLRGRRRPRSRTPSMP